MAGPDISSHLGRGERLLWQGQPSHIRLSAGARALSLLGWAMGAGFGAVLALGLANLGEMDGFFGFWLALVVLNAAGFIALSVVLPRVARREMRARRYAVTQRNLIVVAANGTVRRREIKPGMRIDEAKRRAGAWDVLYAFPAARMVHRPGRPARRGYRRPADGFRGLNEPDARAALAAIRAAQSG